MPELVLHNAVDLLVRHYGRRRSEPRVGEWRTLVELVLERGRSAKEADDWSWIDETLLATPAETAPQTGPRLTALLEGAGRRARHVGVLPGLAAWWLRRFGDRDPAAVFRRRPLEAWQQELRAIRGVGWELADRILLVVGGLDVYPLDRGSMRIAARHGWMDVAAEYDDWQTFFVRGFREAAVDVTVASSGLSRLGREFCGRQPNCEECPLKSLLPARGPVALEGQD